MTLNTKLVIVVRADLPAALAANAAAVLALSLGGRLPHPPAADAKDGSGGRHAGLNPHPVPILSATADQLRDLHRSARADDDLITVGFNEVARQARTYHDYLAALAATPAEEIDYVAVAAYGPRNRITALTKRLPLYAADATVGARPDRTHRKAGLFPTAEDGRFSTPANVGERQLLHDMLRAQRHTLALKCAGVEEALARRTVPPSTLSLLGLVRHLTDVERRWFRQVLAGQDHPRGSRPGPTRTATSTTRYPSPPSSPPPTGPGTTRSRSPTRSSPTPATSTSKVTTPGAVPSRCVGFWCT